MNELAITAMGEDRSSKERSPVAKVIFNLKMGVDEEPQTELHITAEAYEALQDLQKHDRVKKGKDAEDYSLEDWLIQQVYEYTREVKAYTAIRNHGLSMWNIKPVRMEEEMETTESRILRRIAGIGGDKRRRSRSASRGTERTEASEGGQGRKGGKGGKGDKGDKGSKGSKSGKGDNDDRGDKGGKGGKGEKGAKGKGHKEGKGESKEAQTERETVDREPKRKKILCHYWNRGGCKKGASCTYAHGKEEIGDLRVAEEKWEPASGTS